MTTLADLFREHVVQPFSRGEFTVRLLEKLNENERKLIEARFGKSFEEILREAKELQAFVDSRKPPCP